MHTDPELIVVAGESLIDRVTRPDGRTEDIPGGGPFNTARTIARLGGRTAFLGRLSTDRWGRILRASLEEDGVDLSFAPTTADPTLIAYADVDPAGGARYRFEPERSAAAGLAPDAVPGLPAGTIALHIGSLGLVLEPMADTIEALVASTPDDVFVVLDPNIRSAAIRDIEGYRGRLARIVRRVDVVKTSVDDLDWLEPGTDHITAMRRFLDDGPRLAIATDGPRPVRVVGQWDPPLVVDVPRGPVVDTIGAGDAFGGGFLAAWTRGGRTAADLGDRAAVEEAVQFAIRVAGWTVGRAGADPPHLHDLGPA